MSLDDSYAIWTHMLQDIESQYSIPFIIIILILKNKQTTNKQTKTKQKRLDYATQELTFDY